MEKKTFSLSRRIGNTLYRANVYQTPKTTESIEDKILRLIRLEALDICGERGIMNVPHTNRQPERSAIYGCQAG